MNLPPTFLSFPLFIHPSITSFLCMFDINMVFFLVKTLRIHSYMFHLLFSSRMFCHTFSSIYIPLFIHPSIYSFLIRFILILLFPSYSSFVLTLQSMDLHCTAASFTNENICLGTLLILDFFYMHGRLYMHI